MAAPETQVLTGPKAINLMNAILSFLKYGLNRCDGGFGYGTSSCNRYDIGYNDKSEGNTTLVPDETKSVKENIDELATLLTSGRLSAERRLAIEKAYNVTLGSRSALEAYINAEQLIASSPEFHTNSLAKDTTVSREKANPPTATGTPYKAVVYLMLSGGECFLFPYVFCHSFHRLTVPPSNLYRVRFV